MSSLVQIHVLRASGLHLAQQALLTAQVHLEVDEKFEMTNPISGTSDPQWNEKFTFRADPSSELYLRVRYDTKPDNAAPIFSDAHRVAIVSMNEGKDIPFSLTVNSKPAGQIILRIEWLKVETFGPPGGGWIPQSSETSPTPRMVPKLPANQSSFLQYYSAPLLLSPLKEKNDQCNNTDLPKISVASISQDIETQTGGAHIVGRLGLAYRMHFSCAASQIKSCKAAKCMNLKDRLRQVMPGLPSWDEMKEWALQIAACFCSNKQQALGTIIYIITEMVVRYEGTYPVSDADGQSGQLNGEYIRWADAVNLVDLLRLFSWLWAISSGEYVPVSPPKVDSASRHPLFLTDTPMMTALDAKLHTALARSRELGLCPRRVWTIASHLPGREINLLALIPEEKDHFPLIKDPLHDFCTFDFCEQTAVDSTFVKPLHKCGGSCAPTQVFAFAALDEAAINGQPTAWRLDGKSTLGHGQKFIAVSHVWSDGTGQSIKGLPGHRVNQCLYDYFGGIAKGLGCDGIWWDAICVPVEKEARRKAINDMHLNYENAEYTVIHDLYLCNIPWINAEIASFAIIMSSWFTRGWTALELARSKRVLVLFKPEHGKPVIKDLKKDIFAKLGEPSTLVRQVSTAVIKVVQNRLYDLNGLLNALGPRFTSWASDQVIIAQQLARAEPGSSSSHEQYTQVLSHLRQVYDAHLFHDAATVSGSWLPQSLLEVPIAPTSGETLHVEKNGDVVGRWKLLDADKYMIRHYRLLWNDKHPLMDLQVQSGMESLLQKNILLVESNVKIHHRALLVRVMRRQGGQPDSKEILCQFVGPVYFRPTKFCVLGPFVARIVNSIQGLEDLDEEAIDHVARKNPETVTLARGSVGGPFRRDNYVWPDSE